MEPESFRTGTRDGSTRNLRDLMALAAALRRLAQDSHPQEAALFLSAAIVLHRRAAGLAGLRPQNEDCEDRSARHTAPRRKVDIRI